MVQEIIEFSRRMNFRKIGVAFCIGLIREARSFSDILKAHDFEVVSVCCKVSIAPKETLGLREAEKIRPGGHCNPIAQAHAKDRVTGQDPAAVLYTSDSYYNKLKNPEEE